MGGWSDRHWVIDMRKVVPALNQLEFLVRGGYHTMMGQSVRNPESFLKHYYERAVRLPVAVLSRGMAVACCLQSTLRQHGTCEKIEGLEHLNAYGISIKYPYEWNRVKARCQREHYECCCDRAQSCMSE